MTTPPFEQSPALARMSGIRHGFFGRQGPAGAPFNMSDAFGPTDEVTANRETALAAIGADGFRLARLRQVHTTDVITISGEESHAEPPEADGMVTTTPGIALSILTADCVPILLADAQNGVIGACHAGWRGAVSGIMSRTLTAMEALGASPGSTVAAIGPAISGGNYEVGPDFATEVRTIDPATDDFLFIPEDRTREHFDVPGFVEAKLHKLGVRTVDRVGGCTFAEPGRYFSHRQVTKNGTVAGRQISLIAIG